MSEELYAQQREVELYIGHAHDMLQVAADNLAKGYCSTAVNRSYYAIFYAANALLATKSLARSKHSGVISAFREHFVKPGLIEPEYSRSYGQVMDDRHTGDYSIETAIEPERAQTNLDLARRFVERVNRHLSQEGWL